MSAESIARNISTAGTALSVSRKVLSLLTLHASESGNGVTELLDVNQPIPVRYLNVNEKDLNLARLTSQERGGNLYENLLSDGLKRNSHLSTITVLLTRYEVSHVESHDGEPAVNKMHLYGGDSEIESASQTVPIAMRLEKDFIVERIREIFGDDELDDERVDMDQAIKCYISHLSKVRCDANEPDAMWEFIEKTMLPCIKKLQTVTGRDHIGVTNEFWGCQPGGTWDTYPYVFEIPSHRNDPKVLMAFIMENFCRMSGIAAHPISGQSRMMVFRYLSRGVNPYSFSGIDSGGEAAERCNRFFENFDDTPTNTMVYYHLGTDEDVDQDTLQKYNELSVYLSEKSSKAQSHGILPYIGSCGVV